MKRRGELRLILQAIRNDWDMPEAEQIKSMQLVEAVLRDPNATAREQLTAIECCVAAEAANERLASGKTI